jgi:6-phosphogluconolactonase
VIFDVQADVEAAARSAAERLAAVAAAGGHIALSGGSTPALAYRLAALADWSRAHLWWGDDRCVPPDDERSNYRLAKESLLDRVTAQPDVHRIRGELPADEAAALYDRELEGVVLDLALNGLGPDGHTASLFPGSAAVDVVDRRAVAAPAGFEPFVDRVTMTIPVLNASRSVLFLVTGADKAEVVRRAFAGPPDPAIPATLVRSQAGTTVVILDRDAASRLDIAP